MPDPPMLMAAMPLVKERMKTLREAPELLAFLFTHINSPEFQCRFRWREGSIAFWDNRWVQHYGVADYGGYRRIMQRVTIEGDRPI